jgi:hypothetical protein
MDPNRTKGNPLLLPKLGPELGADLVEAVVHDMERAKKAREAKAAKKKTKKTDGKPA